MTEALVLSRRRNPPQRILPSGVWRPYSLSKLVPKGCASRSGNACVTRICPRAGTTAPAGSVGQDQRRIGIGAEDDVVGQQLAIDDDAGNPIAIARQPLDRHTLPELGAQSPGRIGEPVDQLEWPKVTGARLNSAPMCVLGQCRHHLPRLVAFDHGHVESARLLLAELYCRCSQCASVMATFIVPGRRSSKSVSSSSGNVA